MVPTPRIATCGWLMIGSPNCAPKLPGLVMVNVPPCTSSGLSFLARARSATSAMARDRPRMLSSSARLTTGTISPFSSATAMPRLIVTLVDDVVAVDRGVDDRMPPQAVDRHLGDERRVGELDAALLVLGRRAWRISSTWL